jgi:hypothetical protein
MLCSTGKITRDIPDNYERYCPRGFDSSVDVWLSAQRAD